MTLNKAVNITKQTREHKISLPRNRQFLIPLVILSFTSGLFFTLFPMFFSLKQYEHNFVSIAALVIPLSYYFGFIILSYTLLMNELAKDENSLFYVQFFFVGGMFSTMIALLINDRIIMIINILLGLIFQLYGYNIVLPLAKILRFIIIIMTVPAIEEIAKVIVLFFIAKTSVTKPDHAVETRAVKTPALLVFGALIIGFTFILLETMMYTVFQTGLFSDVVQNSWSLFLIQYSLRFGFPLHAVTTLIMAHALNESLYSEQSIHMNAKSFLPFYKFFALAYVIHAGWNYFALYSAPNKYFPFNTISILGFPVPVMLLVIGITLWIIFAYLIFLTITADTTTCPICQNWHKPPYTLETHVSPIGYSALNLTLQVKPHQKNRFYESFLKKVKRFFFSIDYCPECHNKMTNPFVCETCGSVITYTCPTCYAILPPYTRQCWNCQTMLEPPFDTVLLYTKSVLSILSVGYMRLLGFYYLGGTIYFMLFLSRGYRDYMESYTIIVYLLLLSFSLLIVNFWLSQKETKGIGIFMSRILLTLSVILIVITAVSINIITILLLYEYIPSIILSNGLIILVLGLVLYLAVKHLIFDFHPLLHLSK